MKIFHVGAVAVVLAGAGSYVSAGEQAAGRSVWDGVYTADQAKRGTSLYLDECARCHGESQGGGDFGPAIAGDAFFAVWKGKTLNDVFDKIYTTMPLDSPGRLSRQQYADIVAAMLQASHLPAGSEALPAAAAGLTAIKVDRATEKGGQ